MPKDTSSYDACVRTEIKHLLKKGYDRKKAIAAAMNICKDVQKKELEKNIIEKELELKKVNEHRL